MPFVTRHVFDKKPIFLTKIHATYCTLENFMPVMAHRFFPKMQNFDRTRSFSMSPDQEAMILHSFDPLGAKFGVGVFKEDPFDFGG